MSWELSSRHWGIGSTRTGFARGGEDALSETAQAELARLRKEVSELDMDRVLLETASLFFAQEASGTNEKRSQGCSTSLPLVKVAPARTRATKCGAFTARQRVWADSISLIRLWPGGSPHADR